MCPLLTPASSSEMMYIIPSQKVGVKSDVWMKALCILASVWQKHMVFLTKRYGMCV